MTDQNSSDDARHENPDELFQRVTNRLIALRRARHSKRRRRVLWAVALVLGVLVATTAIAVATYGQLIWQSLPPEVRELFSLQ